MTQEEWFEKMQVAVRELHKLSHMCENFSPTAHPVASLVAAQIDVLSHTTNSFSYDNHEDVALTSFDKHGIAEKWDDTVDWRLDTD